MTSHRGVISFALVISAVLAVAAQEPSMASPPAPKTATETIVLIRHGEKPASESGQLACQGLNRALALPKVLIERYGHPDFIFAPDPAKRVTSNGVKYSYLRALATIEPTAIQLGLPVRIKFGYKEIDSLQKELLDARYQRSLIFVAWEHLKLNELVKNLVTSLGGDASIVHDWADEDYDSIYVLKIRTEAANRTVAFQHEHEGLDGLSNDCPERP